MWKEEIYTDLLKQQPVLIGNFSVIPKSDITVKLPFLMEFIQLYLEYILIYYLLPFFE